MREARARGPRFSMEILYLLVPLAVVIAIAIVWALFWAIRSGQFDDLERPKHEIFWEEPGDDKTPTDEVQPPDPARKRP